MGGCEILFSDFLRRCPSRKGGGRVKKAKIPHVICGRSLTAAITKNQIKYFYKTIYCDQTRTHLTWTMEFSPLAWSKNNLSTIENIWTFLGPQSRLSMVELLLTKPLLFINHLPTVTKRTL